MNNTEESPICYICLDNDKDGEKLLAGVCSCRSGSGHCHFSCIVEHGKQKLVDAISSEEFAFNVDAVREVWWKCYLCKQFYHGNVTYKLAKEFNSIVCSNYPNNLELKVEALRFKHYAAEHNNLSAELRESILLDLVAATEDFLATGLGEMSPSVFDNHQYANMALGDMALDRGDAVAAVDHYTKSRKLIESASNNKWSLMKIDVYIANAKAMMPGIDTVSFSKNNMQLFEDFLELTQQIYGPVSRQALFAGEMLEDALIRSKQFIKLERHVVAKYKTSCQLHGTTHPYSVDIKSNLDYWTQRDAKYLPADKCFNIIKYDCAADLYILREKEDGSTLSASPSELIFLQGTPVLCCGLDGAFKDCNGKLGEVYGFCKSTQEYAIHFDDPTLEPIKVKPSNIRVVFELPCEEK